MPLRVNVSAGAENCHFELVPGGGVQLREGVAPQPDVTIRSELAILKELIIQQSKRLFEDSENRGAISVVANSWKGVQAVKQVRQLFSTLP